MRVLVTGGTGFIGAWTAKAIEDAGHTVRYLVRDPARLEPMRQSLGLKADDVATGDITDADSVRRALEGCDAVVHVAAVVTIEPDRAEEMIATNHRGAENVIGQAVELGLDPIVHVSSVAALYAPGLTSFHPELPVGGWNDGYGRSKADVERYVRSLQERDAPIAITYPGMVIGPAAGGQMGESALATAFAIETGFLPGRKATWSIIDVRDLAELHARLLEPGRGPRRYLAGGTPLTLPELAETFTRLRGKKFRILTVPDRWLIGFGKVAEKFRPLLRGQMLNFTEASMRYYVDFPRADNSPSERDLGMVYREPRETLAITVEELRQQGRI
jgi:nucleoside-diphosphate-sugar epimerase